MHVSSVNLAARARKLKIGVAHDPTGIHKRPTDQPVEIGPLGLSGDTIWSKKHHGGPDQAVYVYGEDDYAWWASRARPPRSSRARSARTSPSRDSRPAPRSSATACTSGDGVVLEVTCGRIPCGTLTARMGIRAFTQRFREAGRPGLYCRVIETGAVRGRRRGALRADDRVPDARHRRVRRDVLRQGDPRASSSSARWRRPSASAAGAITSVSSRRCALPERAPRESDCRGVSASGSHTSSSSAGPPAASARSSAGANSLRRLDALAVGAEAARERGEVGIDEVGRHDAARVVPLLVHADRRRACRC